MLVVDDPPGDLLYFALETCTRGLLPSVRFHHSAGLLTHSFQFGKSCNSVLHPQLCPEHALTFAACLVLYLLSRHNLYPCFCLCLSSGQLQQRPSTDTGPHLPVLLSHLNSSSSHSAIAVSATAVSMSSANCPAGWSSSSLFFLNLLLPAHMSHRTPTAPLQPCMRSSANCVPFLHGKRICQLTFPFPLDLFVFRLPNADQLLR